MQFATASTSGAGKGGNLTVTADESIQVIGRSAEGNVRSRLSTQTNRDATGDAGDLKIETGQLVVQDGAFVNAGTFGAGKGGNLTVTASESIKVIGRSADGEDPSGLFAQQNTEKATGDAGDLEIKTGELLVQDGAIVSANTFGAGKAGNLTVTASESIQFIGGGKSAEGNFRPSGLFARTREEATGDAGELNIKTGELVIQDGAQVSASTFGEGNGGDLTVTADESIQVIGRSADGEDPSGLFAQQNTKEASGDAGNLTIQTGQLLVRDGAQVAASTFGAGNGGNLTVTADESIQVIGSGRSADNEFSSALSAQANRRATGDAGELKIKTGELVV